MNFVSRQVSGSLRPFYFHPSIVKRNRNGFSVSKLLEQYSFHHFEWTKIVILMDLRRSIDRSLD